MEGVWTGKFSGWERNVTCGIWQVADVTGGLKRDEPGEMVRGSLEEGLEELWEGSESGIIGSEWSIESWKIIPATLPPGMG